MTAAFVLYLLKQRSRRLAMYIAIMAVLFAILNSAGPASRIDPSAISRDSSSLYRMEIWKAAFRLFLEQPAFGHGIGTAWYFLFGSTDKLHGYILHCHNIYLQVAVEMGITGLCAFICLMVRKISDGVRLLRKGTTEEEASVIMGFIACAAGIAVHGLIDAVIFVPGLSLAFIGYAAMYGSVASATALSFDGEGVPKLFGGKGAGNEKYQEEEGEACQA
jgi:O-antigen ligase